MSTMSPLQIVLAKVVECNLRSCLNGDASHHVQCPVHDDQNGSLHVSAGDNGGVVLHCFTDCPTAAIVEALGLTMADLFADTRNPGSAKTDSGLTLQEYADAKKLEIAKLQGWGLSDRKHLGHDAVRISYRNEAGEEVSVRWRHTLEKGPIDQRFTWSKGHKPLLYGLWRLGKMQGESIVLVEGESDCHTLWSIGVAALGVPGASTWRDEWASHLDRFKVIYVVLEPDKSGEVLRKSLRGSRIRDRVRLVSCAPFKDPSVMYLDDLAQFQARIDAALAASEPWPDQTAQEIEAEKAAAWEQCKHLSSDPAILDRVCDALHDIGVVGKDKAAKLIYLALTSRLLDRIVSVVVKGKTSLGKSFVSGHVLKFFPSDAYIDYTSTSPRAIIYDTKPIDIVLWSSLKLLACKTRCRNTS